MLHRFQAGTKIKFTSYAWEGYFNNTNRFQQHSKIFQWESHSKQPLGINSRWDPRDALRNAHTSSPRVLLQWWLSMWAKNSSRMSFHCPLGCRILLHEVSVSPDWLAIATAEHAYWINLKQTESIQYHRIWWYNCRVSHTGDALRVGCIRGCQAEEFVLAEQVWTGLL